LRLSKYRIKFGRAQTDHQDGAKLRPTRAAFSWTVAFIILPG
jgi:hypothetical protein